MEFTSNDYIQLTLFDSIVECIKFDELEENIKVYNKMGYCNVLAIVSENLEEGSDKFRE